MNHETPPAQGPVDVDVSLQVWMIGWKPDPNCRSCDGSGVFYGNVCPCGCLRSEANGNLVTEAEHAELTKAFEAENDLSANVAVSGTAKRSFDGSA